MTQLNQTVTAYVTVAVVSLRRWLGTSRRGERGSVTLEHLIWAIVIIAVVAIAAAAITAAINRRTDLLN